MAADDNSYYINVTQDGIARLANNSPAQIVGVTTNSVETCVVYIFVGENGNISFLHAATTVSMECIQKEFNWAKPLETWHVIVNHHGKYDKDRPELQTLTKVKDYMNNHAQKPPEERYPTEKVAISVTYRRYVEQKLSSTDESPKDFPILMPPFADKLLAISFLNGLVSGLNTVNLLMQFDVDRWVLEDNMTYNAKEVFNNESDIDSTLCRLTLPPTITYERLKEKKDALLEEVKRLKTSSNVSWTEIINEYIWDNPALEQLRNITGGYPFIGIRLNSKISAWLFIDDNDAMQGCQKFIKGALNRSNIKLEFEDIENPRNTTSKSINTIRIGDIEKYVAANKPR